MKPCTVFDDFTLDASAIATEREFTPEGFLIVPGKIARTGIQQYYARELRLDEEGVPGDKVIRLYRPAEEVSNPASVATGENKAVTIGHPKDGVNANNWRDLAVGEARDLQYVPDNAPNGGHIKAKLIIKDAAAIKAIQSGKTQLSCGYTFDLDRTPGTTASGEPHDGIMRNIRFNHHAIVDFARGGSGLRIADEKQGVPSMSTKKIAVDGFTLELPENEAVAIEHVRDERDKLVKDLADHLEASREAIGAKDEQLSAKDTEIAQLKEDNAKLKAVDVNALAEERAKVLGATSKLCPELATDGKTVDQIRRAVVAEVSAKSASSKVVADAIVGADLAKASDILVAAAFNALTVAAKANDAQRAAGDEAVSQALLGGKQNANDQAPEMSAREKWIAGQQAK